MTTDILVAIFMLFAVICKALLLASSRPNGRWVENVAVITILSELLVSAMIADYVFKWGLFF